MSEIIFSPKQMSPQDIDNIMYKSGKKIYSWPVLIRKALKTGWQTRKFQAMMFAFSSNINYRNVSSVGKN
jgi:hypothetical protein